MISQCAGAILAALVVTALFGKGFGTHALSSPAMIALNIGVEVMLTFFLMLTIIAVATDRRISGAAPAMAIGFAVVLGVQIGVPVTGGSMNPARSFGPAIVSGGTPLTNYWLYLIGPIAGAVFAALTFECLRLEKEHSKGAPNELFEALEDVAGQ